ncbi:MAG: L-threonylcarbamoyladenylate synthase [Candidatus Micrarchaeota archaeon]|nr:L-threonylcarbamoyladenylate synthase [Candidatus Micrarchaeota archaeon]
MALTIPLSDHDTAFEAALAAIKAGGIVAYPTDTLYGLGCDATNPSAVKRLRALKCRDPAKPFSIIVSDFPMLLRFCRVSSEQEKILHKLLPGPYTFILPLKHPLPISETLEAGVRVPEHAFMRAVSKSAGVPIVSSSANLSGGKDASELSGVARGILDGCDLAIDGGRCKYAMGSTVIDLIRMEVLRRGAVRTGDSIEF